MFKQSKCVPVRYFLILGFTLALTLVNSFKINRNDDNQQRKEHEQYSKIIIIKQDLFNHQPPLPLSCNYVYSQIRTNLQNYEITFFNSFFRLFDVKYKTRNLARFQSSVLLNDNQNYNLYRFKYFDDFEWPVRYYTNLGKNYEGVLLKIGEFIYRENSFLKFLNENTKIRLLKNANSIVRLREKSLLIGRRLRKRGDVNRHNQSLFNIWKCEILDPLKKIFGRAITDLVTGLPITAKRNVHIVPTKKKPFRKIKSDRNVKKIIVNKNRFHRIK